MPDQEIETRGDPELGRSGSAAAPYGCRIGDCGYFTSSESVLQHEAEAEHRICASCGETTAMRGSHCPSV
jgi:hypothetical protein